MTASIPALRVRMIIALTHVSVAPAIRRSKTGRSAAAVSRNGIPILKICPLLWQASRPPKISKTRTRGFLGCLRSRGGYLTPVPQCPPSPSRFLTGCPSDGAMPTSPGPPSACPAQSSHSWFDQLIRGFLFGLIGEYLLDRAGHDAILRRNTGIPSSGSAAGFAGAGWGGAGFGVHPGPPSATRWRIAA